MRKIILVFICFFLIQSPGAQRKDSLGLLQMNTRHTPNDSITKETFERDSIAGSNKNIYHNKVQILLLENRYINSNATPERYSAFKKKTVGNEVFFYAIAALLLFFGLLKMFYARYLNTLFRVFFNTSLRQSQLTDQLLQAKLPSLFFNLFFILTGGFYLYFLLYYFGFIDKVKYLQLLGICIGALCIIYFLKYAVIKFTGWISGYSKEADTYIFIVFLINKMIGIFLIPVIIIMAFSDYYLVKGVVYVSFFIIIAMHILRFLRSYSILQNKLKVKRYHFFLYIIGIEILPLLLIYKSAIELLTKNL